MSVSEENFDLEDKSLSLIDVSFEDDCLYNSPSRDPQFLHSSDDQTQHKTVQFSLGAQTLGDSLEGDGQVTQKPLESEQEKTRRNEKYNLRKSLAWDSAFFTSAGVLEPDELSSIIGGAEKGERKHMLPGIEEDIHRSTDSISTLATDSSTLGTLEDDLFGDIRASIQKSSKTLNTAFSQGKAGSGADESKHTKSLQKVENVYQNKLKTKAAPRKPNVTIKGSGKVANQVSPSAQASKSNSKNGEAISSLCKPPKIVGRPSAILATIAATKRASLGLGANRVKMEKDNTKNLTAHSEKSKSLPVPAKGAKVPAVGGSRNTVPKPMLPVKSSLRSSVATKKQLTTSSSIDSLESLSSDSSSNHSLNIAKRKIDSRTCSTGSTVKNTLRTASRNKNQPTSLLTSPYLKSLPKPSSSISPASSVSEWSSELSSPTSTINKRSNSSRPSLDNDHASQVLASKNKCSVGHGTQVSGLPSECVKQVSRGSGGLVHPDSVKPSGLRMPSPKIGYFDGARSTVRTPNGSSQPHPTVPSDLPRFGAANVSPSGGSKNVKPGKLQPARNVVVQGTKIAVQKPALECQPKSPLPLQESSNTAPNAFSATRNEKNRPCISLKVQNRKSPKAEKVATKESNTAINNPEFGYVETNNSLCKDKMSPQGKGDAFVKDAELVLSNRGSGTTHNSSSVSEVENITISQKAGEGAICGEKNDLSSFSNVKEKEKACVQDQVDGLIQHVGALDICQEIQQKPIGDFLSIDDVNESTEVNTNALQAFVKLSIPAPSLTPIDGVKVAEIDKS
ncbi:uncharacterized protein LOC8283823 isoform X1 [Ricinus communis]|uniref:uncharacterized protein LOC8283823 isoform X1 n=1 Tax=Ricinus communis TaxID=3988 RepID=UPI00201A9149|nr:uncharacterized protein LOC8283823 isoform X1 [Ricinus communis]XP_015578512.2 uncharacterized protein LOC8283823 isoform X1 [Ricinus communis]